MQIKNHILHTGGQGRPPLQYGKKDFSCSVKENETTDKSFHADNNSNEKCNNSNSLENRDFLDIFGIRLHYDDVLLLSLIFFLYNEGVNDTGLFIALILLLLS